MLQIYFKHLTPLIMFISMTYRQRCVSFFTGTKPFISKEKKNNQTEMKIQTTTPLSTIK